MSTLSHIDQPGNTPREAAIVTGTTTTSVNQYIGTPANWSSW